MTADFSSQEETPKKTVRSSLEDMRVSASDGLGPMDSKFPSKYQLLHLSCGKRYEAEEP